MINFSKIFPIKLLLAAVLLTLTAAACTSPAAQTATPVTADNPVAAPPAAETLVLAPNASIIVTDALGRQVTLEKAPERIVITGKAAFALVDAFYTFPEASDKITALGNSGQGTGNFIRLIDTAFENKTDLKNDPSVEQIAAVNPDLVIIKSYLYETLGKPLEELKIPVVTIDFETPDQYWRDLETLGRILNNEARANEVSNFYKTRLSDIETRLKDVTKKPKVLLLYYTDKDGAVAFNVPPMEWIQTQMVTMAGGDPVWRSANPAGGWTKVTLEQIAAWDADEIFIIAYFADPGKVVETLRKDAQWQSIRAVKEGHLYAFAGDLYSWDQPDVRWILGLTWLAGKIHPDQFTDMDITVEAQKFYQDLYGLDLTFFEEKILPLFKGDLP